MSSTTNTVQLPENYKAMKTELEDELSKRLKVAIRADMRVGRYGMLNADIFNVSSGLKFESKIAGISGHMDAFYTHYYLVAIFRNNIPGAKEISKLNFLKRVERKESEKTLKGVQHIISNILKNRIDEHIGIFVEEFNS